MNGGSGDAATEAERDVSASTSMTSRDDFRSADELPPRLSVLRDDASGPNSPPSVDIDELQVADVSAASEDQVSSAERRQRAVKWRDRPRSAVPPSGSGPCAFFPNSPSWTNDGPLGGGALQAAGADRVSGSISGGRLTTTTAETVLEDRDATTTHFRFVCRDNLGGGVCRSLTSPTATFQTPEWLSEGEAVTAVDGIGGVPVLSPPFDGPSSSPGVVPLDVSSIPAVSPPAAGESVEGSRQVVADAGSVKVCGRVKLRSPASPTTGNNSEDVAGTSDDEDEGEIQWRFAPLLTYLHRICVGLVSSIIII